MEEKYLLDAPQTRAVLSGLIGRMRQDGFGRSTVSSVYYDTEDYRLVRASLEKPAYKEKLRLRGYGRISADSTVFLELKKKADGVTYKRRAELPLSDAAAFLSGRRAAPDTQVLREIRRFMEFYRPVPRVLIAATRTAYVGAEEGLRITFDEDVRFRTEALSLTSGDWGALLLPFGKTIMEIKLPGAMPLWLAELLSENGIFPVSYSKYGACYRSFLYPQAQERQRRSLYA